MRVAGHRGRTTIVTTSSLRDEGDNTTSDHLKLCVHTAHSGFACVYVGGVHTLV